MIRATDITQPPFESVDTVTLDSNDRHRRRLQLVSDNGIRFLLDFESARLLRHGEGIVLEDNRIVEIIARPEPLMEVRGVSPQHLLGLAYQLGNRHQPAEICADRIKIRRDPIIADMLRGLGGKVVEIEDRFNPQGGAYDHSHSHGHTYE